MLDRKNPATLATKLTIKGQGESIEVPVEFHNRTQNDIKAKQTELAATDEAKKDTDYVNRGLFLYIVKEFNGKTPTHDGVQELEQNWPGAVEGVFFNYHMARRVEVVKN